nr:MAG TPA: hypothetical protein [Caudoviricetes sp.]
MLAFLEQSVLGCPIFLCRILFFMLIYPPLLSSCSFYTRECFEGIWIQCMLINSQNDEMRNNTLFFKGFLIINSRFLKVTKRLQENELEAKLRS